MTMTKDLISRQDAIDYLISKANRIGAYGYISTKEIYDYLSVLPPAQPEIIRCNDCKFSHMTVNGECKYCDIWFPDEKCYMDGDYFCGSAERRTE